MSSMGEYLIKLLEQYDVEHVFGIPGVHTAELYRGLAQSNIRHITPRHEQGAGFMADGYARITGKPGVCLVITGPGLSNIATPMLQALGDSIPMLVISGVNNEGSPSVGSGHLHEMPNQRAFTIQASRASSTVRTAEQLGAALERAFEIFESERPGPVHIDIPLESMEQSVPCAKPGQRPAFSRTTPAQVTVERIAAQCRSARTPVVVVGGGARRGAESAIKLAEHLDCPIIGTINARSVLPQAHPLAIPASLSATAVHALLNNADLVIAAGTQLGPTDLDVMATGAEPTFHKLVRIDIDTQQIARGPQAHLALQADAALSLEAILRALSTDPARFGDGHTIAARVREQATKDLSPVYQQHVALLDDIRRALPDAALVGDSTQIVYAGNGYFDNGSEGHWFNSSTGYGTLGYALPAAIGAAIADPTRPVIALSGDGGIQFTLGELGVIRDYQVPVIIVVWNNAGYGEIRSFMQERQIAPEGVNLTPPDFVQIALAYGLNGVALDGPASLADTIKQAVGDKQATLIEVRNV